MKTKKNHYEVAQPAKAEWVVVGDASRFIVFEKMPGKPFASFKTFTNNLARTKISVLERDQPGRSFDSYTRSSGSHHTGAPRHAYSSRQDPKEHGIETFVREVGAFLDKSHMDHSFDRLVLVANTPLIGKLRGLLSKNTQCAISAEYAKDFAWINGSELESRVQSLLALH